MTELDGTWLAEQRLEEESGLAGGQLGWRLVRARLGRPDGARRAEEPWVREGRGGARAWRASESSQRYVMKT